MDGTTSYSLTLDRDATAVALRLDLPRRLSLRWSPLLQERNHVAVVVLSPCCGASLDAPLSRQSGRYTCSKCYLPQQASIRSFTLTNGGASWHCREEDLERLFPSWGEPLRQELLRAVVRDVLVKSMNRASGEYAWTPEGNLRGPLPLPVGLQEEICSRIATLLTRDLDDSLLPEGA